jgi:tetratricopeptide (TPR) repeat protein
MPTAPVRVRSHAISVFLCHSSTDKPVVRQLYERLKALHGIKPWLDEEALLPGADWRYEIVQAVRKAEVVIICLSHAAVGKEGYIQKEIATALDVADEKPEGTIFLIPLRLDDCEIPARLSRWHAVNYFEDGGFDKVTHALEARARALGASLTTQQKDESSPSPQNQALPIIEALVAAGHEYSHPKSTRLLERALVLVDEWISAAATTEAFVLKAQIFAELARLSPTPQRRANKWDAVMTVLDRAWTASPSGTVAVEHAYLAIDRLQDPFSNAERLDRLRQLRTARDRVETALRSTTNPSETGPLLAVKAALLRHLAETEAPQSDARHQRLAESYRCASLAVERSDDPACRLELAAAAWALSRHEKTDEAYKQKLDEAEACFRQAALAGFEPARFALARFYRMTFRPLDACTHYPRAGTTLKNPRTRLRESYLYAEAAVQLWHNDYPRADVMLHLQEARALLEAALGAGYKNARIIVALAFTSAIIDGPDQGDIVLTNLSENPEQLWTEALRIITEEAPDRLLDLGFVLGINRATVWTLLGTYVLRFRDDQDLASALYQAAVSINPRNAVAATNLARFLIQRGDPASITRARQLLQTAARSADRRFLWWRVVSQQLPALPIKHQPSGNTTATQKTNTTTAPPGTFKNIRNRFKQIEALTDAHQRGYQLEALVYDIANLTVDTAAPSYRIQRGTASTSQIDAYFESHAEKYRVECKWRQDQAEPADVIALADKIDAVGVSGALISMNGFSRAAIERAKELRLTKAILLIDGNEIRGVIKEVINFDQLIRKKRLYFDQRSEPYYRFTTEAEVA